MKEPTKKEMQELVEFSRLPCGELSVLTVKGNVRGNVEGSVWGSVWGSLLGSVGCDVVGHVEGGVWGHVKGSVSGNVYGTINGREWQFIETPKEKAIRLIREGKSEEAIMALEESE